MHPEAADHTFAVLSPEAISTCWPSGEKTAELTEPSFREPIKVSKHAPEAADHTFAVLSMDAVSTCWPSGEKPAELTWLV